MKDFIKHWFTEFGIELSQLQMGLVMVGVIVIISLLIHWLFHKVMVKVVDKMTRKSRHIWRAILFEKKLFSRLALTVQGIIIFIQINLWLNPEGALFTWLQTLTLLWITLFLLLTLFSLVNGLGYMARQHERTRDLPIQGFLQAIKLVFTVVAIIFMIAVVVNKSPTLIISGLGAMAAVLMLVFKDPLLGFVAGIQLSVNDMLRIGDWLEMPSYGADGDVIEIGLTTVKVQNWDKTITTIPTYALISDSFKNWQGMTQSGGRRIMRSIYIDVTSVKFMDDELMERLSQASLLAPYLEEKNQEIKAYNSEHDFNMELKINGRRLTNLGTLRAYLVNMLKNHPGIHQEMTLMVRQQAAENQGIPLQIYAFTNTTVWAEYEAIQSDIFDHIYAVMDAFDLRIHQSPGSADVRFLRETLAQSTAAKQQPETLPAEGEIKHVSESPRT
ncbi:mechanosensitive ion channel family protein [Marinicella gelatinilytica]|uniref:mechanosensitive ion channel family protein n=1 Tax=Marinicella gelatinilytica TaxID=2996017 RepID=UPI002260C5DE|nr:mechanosensitive ion channel domain-containing protein [Marinicella gelatinilytica]MCX7544134.1 mechanosensitive ion channel [Marinicella gelatinilytica]